MRTIGVFDSGRGGQSVAEAVKRAFPDDHVVFREDSGNLPYGNKTPEQLLGIVTPILQEMTGQGCDVIVIACNTVTTTLITQLREHISVPLIGIEPMVKPAAKQTKSGIIAVCATPTTLGSSRYTWLKDTYAKAVTVLEPDCSDWAAMIEANDVDKEKVERRISDVLDAGADVIVLGCTHYHWIEQDMQRLAQGRAAIIQPESAIIQQLQRVLSTLAS